MSFERHVVLPQTISVVRQGKQLQNALEARPFPSMKDSRDEPGTVESGRSKLDRNRLYFDDRHQTHPVPVYNGVECIRMRRATDGHGFFTPEQKDIDVIQVTKSPLSPDLAEAFANALAEDPTHPFVLAHIAEGFELNGSDSWLTVGGPALAIPLTRIDPEDARTRRRKDYVHPDPEGELTELEVQVENLRGLRGDDFIAAARRHEVLAHDGITVGAVTMLSLKPLAYRAGEDELTGREIAMFKVACDGRTLGLYATAEEAREALLNAATAGEQYRSEGALFTGSDYAFRASYAVEGCLVLDGREVRSSFSTELVKAKATVEVRVVRLQPGKPAPHVGWMIIWQAPDWHRNPEILTEHLDLDGSVISRSRSGWGY